jgi:cbb3-type cytochrome oxidase maturation protein
MSVIYVLVPAAALLAAAAVWAFIRAVRGGQFDDLDTPAIRMLLDDEEDAGDGVHPGGARRSEPSDRPRG